MNYLNREVTSSRRSLIPPYLRDIIYKTAFSIGYSVSNVGKKIGRRLYVLAHWTDYPEKPWTERWDFNFEED